MRVAIYVRVSTLEQAEEGYSIGEQIDKLTKYCGIKDWNVYKVYKDPGFSGSNIDRPGISQLIFDAKQQLFDTVLVYKLDRLSRSQKDTLYIIEDVLGANNVSFVSLNENFDTATAFGKAMIGILAVFAQLEREQIRERMTLGKIGRAKSGKAMSWRWTAFGYSYPEDNSRDTYEIVPLEAQIVRQIFSDYLSGISITKLRQKMNDEGHIAKEKPWSYRTIRQLLGNPVYAGYTTWKDQVFPGNHEAIISKETFEETQKQLAKRQKEAYEKNNNPRPFQAKYMLSGMIRCGVCGSSFNIELRVPHKDGTRERFYRCYSHYTKNKNYTMKRNPNGCTSPSYNLKDLESAVLSQIEKLRINPEMVKKIAGESNGEAEEEALKKRLVELNTQLEKVVALYLDDEIPKNTLESKKKTIVEEKKGINAKLKKIQSKKTDVSPKEVVNELGKIKGTIFKLDYESQKVLVRKLIKKVVVYPARIEIFWTFEV